MPLNTKLSVLETFGNVEPLAVECSSAVSSRWSTPPTARLAAPVSTWLVMIGPEEKPIEPPGELGEGAVRCPECGYRNMPSWGHCYACGTALLALLLYRLYRGGGG